DAASFLWRWRYYDVGPSLDREWTEVAAHARRHFPRASLAFADLHAALAEAANGDEEGLQSRISGLQTLVRDGGLPPGDVAANLCAGMAALGRGDNAEALRIPEPAPADLPRSGRRHAPPQLREGALVLV